MVFVVITDIVNEIVEYSVVRESLKSRGPSIMLRDEVRRKRVNSRTKHRTQQEVYESLEPKEVEN